MKKFNISNMSKKTKIPKWEIAEVLGISLQIYDIPESEQESRLHKKLEKEKQIFFKVSWKSLEGKNALSQCKRLVLLCFNRERKIEKFKGQYQFAHLRYDMELRNDAIKKLATVFGYNPNNKPKPIKSIFKYPMDRKYLP